MLLTLTRWKHAVQKETDSQKIAGELFAAGKNCCQAVFQATTDRHDDDFDKICKAFGGGIGDRKCLCGAVTGGIMALGISNKGHLAGAFLDRFRKEQGSSCCAALTKGFAWGSRSHIQNCRRITTESAALVQEFLASSEHNLFSDEGVEHEVVTFSAV